MNLNTHKVSFCISQRKQHSSITNNHEASAVWGGGIEHAYTLWLIAEFLVLSLAVINLSDNHWLPFPVASFIALTRQSTHVADKRREVNQVK